MMAQLEHGHCTAYSKSWWLHQPWLKTRVGEGGHTAVGLDPINEGVQPDVLQQGSGVARVFLRPGQTIKLAPLPPCLIALFLQ